MEGGGDLAVGPHLTVHHGLQAAVDAEGGPRVGGDVEVGAANEHYLSECEEEVCIGGLGQVVCGGALRGVVRAIRRAARVVTGGGVGTDVEGGVGRRAVYNRGGQAEHPGWRVVVPQPHLEGDLPWDGTGHRAGSLRKEEGEAGNPGIALFGDLVERVGDLVIAVQVRILIHVDGERLVGHRCAGCWIGRGLATERGVLGRNNLGLDRLNRDGLNFFGIRRRGVGRTGLRAPQARTGGVGVEHGRGRVEHRAVHRSPLGWAVLGSDGVG